MKKHLSFLCLFTFIPFAAASTVDAATVEYSAGHGDIGLAFEGGELELHYHFGTGAILDGVPLVGEIEYDPDEAHVRVSDATRSVTLADLAFLGTTAGDPVWRLPQNNVAGRPFLGIASEELNGLGFSGATIQLTSFSGPGQFALWQPGGLGGFDVMWQTNDGIGPTDLLNLGIGVHDHFNYGFTAEGIYDVGLTAVAQFSAGGSVTDSGVFRFVVGSATAVPEPSSWALLLIAGAFGLIRIRRDSRRTDDAALAYDGQPASIQAGAG